jgi:hypothetical protein
MENYSSVYCILIPFQTGEKRKKKESELDFLEEGRQFNLLLISA